MNEINIVASGLAFGVGTLMGMAIVYFSPKTRTTIKCCPDCGSLEPVRRYFVPRRGMTVHHIYTPDNSEACINSFHDMAERGEGTR